MDPETILARDVIARAISRDSSSLAKHLSAAAETYWQSLAALRARADHDVRALIAAERMAIGADGAAYLISINDPDALTLIMFSADMRAAVLSAARAADWISG